MVLDAHDALSNHVQDKTPKKDSLCQKSKEETKELAFAQAKLNGSMCYVHGKKGRYANMCLQKESVEFKD